MGRITVSVKARGYLYAVPGGNGGTTVSCKGMPRRNHWSADIPRQQWGKTDHSFCGGEPSYAICNMLREGVVRLSCVLACGGLTFAIRSLGEILDDGDMQLVHHALENEAPR